MTPAEACPTKKRFALRVHAEAKALSLMNHPRAACRSGRRLWVYQCPTCGGWHLTSREPAGPLDPLGLREVAPPPALRTH